MDVGEVNKGRRISVFKPRVDQPVVPAVVVTSEPAGEFFADVGVVAVCCLYLDQRDALYTYLVVRNGELLVHNGDYQSTPLTALSRWKPYRVACPGLLVKMGRGMSERLGSVCDWGSTLMRVRTKN